MTPTERMKLLIERHLQEIAAERAELANIRAAIADREQKLDEAEALHQASAAQLAAEEKPAKEKP